MPFRQKAKFAPTRDMIAGVMFSLLRTLSLNDTIPIKPLVVIPKKHKRIFMTSLQSAKNVTCGYFKV